MTLLTPEPEPAVVVDAPARTCKLDGCEQEAMPRRQWCYEDWIARQPAVVRADAAARRRALVPVACRVDRVPPSRWPAGRRWCSGCQTFVRLVDCPGGGSRCRACTSTAQHLSRLVNEFGIDPVTYAELFNRQGGRCAICRGRPTTVRLAVDHDHGCCKEAPLCGSCTRGLLCSKCNHELLGAAHDSLQILLNAVQYLRTPPVTGDWLLPEVEVAEFERRYGAPDPAPF